MDRNLLTPNEIKTLSITVSKLISYAKLVDVDFADVRFIRDRINYIFDNDLCRRSIRGVNPIFRKLNTALLLCAKVSPDKNMAFAIILSELTEEGGVTIEEVTKRFGDDVSSLVRGLLKVSSIYKKRWKIQQHGTPEIAISEKEKEKEKKKKKKESEDNFRGMMLTFAEDIRVVIVMIVDWLYLMYSINHNPDQEYVRQVVKETETLYAPLAHRLGLYSIKSELEDMSLKYRERKTYDRIAHDLKQTKAKRDAYIASFIAPVKQRLIERGYVFDIKGRTKSISSIQNKLLKQKINIEGIYDLFAIRIILDSEPENEIKDCWGVFSEITNMYTPNPSRTKDWLTIRKSNGYQSLHTTVLGPENRWVEVQIRTKRMDEVAEKGIAAHWLYKGVKKEDDLDEWMKNVRDVLDTAKEHPMELIKDLKIDVYDKEVFAFSPKGKVVKLPLGASVLDFAFAIHSNLGSKCTGGIVNGKNQKISYKINNGDIIEILTSPNQTPKLDWLNFVITSKARNKIRTTIKEMNSKSAELGKELISRRFKNRKIEVSESKLTRVIKRLGYKTNTHFYQAIAKEEIDPNDVIALYETIDVRNDEQESRSADTFVMQSEADEAQSDNVLVIGANDIKGLNYKLAKCCNPIYGDDVFGFISSEGIVKVHKSNCPNAANIRQRYPYRVIATRWSGKIGTQFGATLRVVGHDDIGIVSNITSIINKENNVSLRNISIDSNDGLFQGYLVVGVSDRQTLNNLIKKIKTVKGVKDVERS